MATLVNLVVETLFPPETSRLQALRQEMPDAPLFGSTSNHSFFAMQVNISPLTTKTPFSLGYGGVLTPTGTLQYFLGIQVHRSKEQQLIHISQSGYIRAILSQKRRSQIQLQSSQNTKALSAVKCTPCWLQGQTWHDRFNRSHSSHKRPQQRISRQLDKACEISTEQ